MEIKKITRQSDGWYSEDGGMSWNNPAPDASVGVGAAWVKTGEVSFADVGGRNVWPRQIVTPEGLVCEGRAGGPAVFGASPQNGGDVNFIAKPIEVNIQEIRQEFKRLEAELRDTYQALRAFENRASFAELEVARYKGLYETTVARLEKLRPPQMSSEALLQIYYYSVVVGLAAVMTAALHICGGMGCAHRVHQHKKVSGMVQG